MNLCNFQNYFVDFLPMTFSNQAKQIFEEVGYGLKEGNLNLISKILNENVFNDGELKENNHLTEIFCQKTSDWKIVHARTLYLTDFLDSLSNNYAQITLSYMSEDKQVKYIVFEREISNNYLFYHWKIFIPKYHYFI